MKRVYDHGAPQPARRSILIVDDEDYIADMLAAALTLEGYTTHVAYNGREGLKRAQSLRPSLLIIDVMMPYMSGLALVELLRREDHIRDVPVLLISAGVRPNHLDSGVTFIAKPFALEQLLSLVIEHIGSRPGMLEA